MTWTAAEFKKFDRLSLACGSADQLTRIKARLSLNAFIKEHGKAKCDAMWEELQRREKL